MIRKKRYDQLRSDGYEQRYSREDFGYTQEDIFRDILRDSFAGEIYEDLGREFARHNLRFDNKFFDQSVLRWEGVCLWWCIFYGAGWL